MGRRLPNSSSGSGSASGPLRFIAIRAAVPMLVSAGNFSMMSRWGTFARDDISSVKIAWANWLPDGTLTGAAGNVMSVAASIEYPAGVFTQLKFGGLTVGSAGPLTTLWSDYAYVPIPNGAQFWVRTWQNATSGGVLYNLAAVNASLGEASEVPGSNKTVSGVVAASAGLICGPCAIVGRSRKPAAFIIGDSRQAGWGDNGSSAIGGFGEMNNGLITYAHTVNAMAGNTAGGYLGTAGALQSDLAQYASDVVSAFGINDLNSISAATLQANQATIRSLYTAAKFHVTTLDPSTSSTDLWATLVNQTPVASNAQRVIYNTAVRLNSLGYDPAFDCAAVSESSFNSGKWKVDGTPNKYVDGLGLHPTPFCNALYAGAGFTL